MSEKTEPVVHHELKTWPEFYEAIRSENKRFELRKDDRRTRFKVGDNLTLREFEPCQTCVGERRVWDNGDKVECPDCKIGGTYTGRMIGARITFLLTPDSPCGQGIRDGYALLSIQLT